MYHEVPDLEFITLTKIAITLWSGQDIDNSIIEYFIQWDQRRIDNWTDIEESVNLKIENCQTLPTTLKIKLMGLVKPIGKRLKAMIQYTYDNEYLPNYFTSMLTWTFLGTINTEETIKTILKDENLSFEKRYVLASTYCLTDDVFTLWNNLSEVDKNNYLGGIMRRNIRCHLQIYWAYHVNYSNSDTLQERIQEQFNTTFQPCQFGLRCALAFSNLPAVKYFSKNVPVNVKLETYWYYFHNLELREGVAFVTDQEQSVIYIPDIICFILSELNEEQRMVSYERYAYFILKHFLEFPFQRLFWGNAKNTCRYLTKSQKSNLLQRITRKVSENYTDFDYETLRTELSKM
ncbi:ANK_REP_REGION domain-containing protein [Nephila pilipes]|uniref:ANK_REP_REGION domain-containing protein n=1 Tax=Nephila pilipes TaxID=299642 RepID=A0A8X6PFZ7_NEPPI|nr:ANK_REP_REGION domain-containing protein [Nephila pilipes]